MKNLKKTTAAMLAAALIITAAAGAAVPAEGKQSLPEMIREAIRGTIIRWAESALHGNPGKNEAETAEPTPAPTPEPTALPTQALTPVPTAAPTVSPASLIDEDGTIHYGASDPAVRKIQRRLNELGYPAGYADGIYGQHTQDAVNLFCEMTGVSKHSYISPGLQKKIFAKDAPVYDPYLPLKKGDYGERVLIMQRRLKELGYDPGKLDGKYGKMTVEAVAAYQLDYGFVPGAGEKPGEKVSREMLVDLFMPPAVVHTLVPDAVTHTATP